MIPATVYFDQGNGEAPLHIETGLGCSPFIGMTYEFSDSDRNLDLVGKVTAVSSRDLDGDVDLIVMVEAE